LSHFRAHHADFEAAGFRWLGEERVLRGGDIDLPPWLSDTPKPAKG
jgi:hypothetical protein